MDCGLVFAATFFAPLLVSLSPCPLPGRQTDSSESVLWTSLRRFGEGARRMKNRHQIVIVRPFLSDFTATDNNCLHSLDNFAFDASLGGGKTG